MRFYRSDGGVCEVSAAAVAVIERHVQRHSTAPEAGGLLLGRLILNTDDVVIDVATGPASQDRQGRCYFFRARGHAQRRVDDAWAQSSGTVVYLGEWHTHPEDDPVPSRVDLSEWKRIAQDTQIEQGFLLFLIAGRKKWRVWEILVASGDVQPLARAKA